MSRATVLIAAIAKNATYIANLDAAAKKKPLNAKQKASRASAVAKFDAYVTEYAASLGTTTPTSPPVTPPTGADPYPGKSMADRSRAWNRAEALDNIKGAYERAGVGPATTPAQKLAILGPGLFGQGVCMGQFGAPGADPGIDTKLGNPFGGVWMALPEFTTEGHRVNVWHASEIVFSTPWTHEPQDFAPVGYAHGINANNDGPADDYTGEFTAPVDF